jgi:ParB family chromosome partitioning protein
MSRKGLFSDVEPGKAAGASGAGAPSPSVRHFGAALGQMRERATRTSDLERALAAGDRVVEIDPALIDPSPIPDRLPGAGKADEALKASLDAEGQRVPVLLRRKASEPGRYLTVYGHRRIAALGALGRPVKAIVAEMSDDEAYVAQGVENNARRDLSFIERAVFARRLAEEGTSQARIADALHTAQPNVATMIGLARRVPSELVLAIGASPAIGRRRWMRVDELLAEKRQLSRVWRLAIVSEGFAALDGDERFEVVVKALEAAVAAPSAVERITLSDRDGASFALVERLRGGEARIRLQKAQPRPADGAAFIDWLSDRLPDLREAWRRGD